MKARLTIGDIDALEKRWGELDAQFNKISKGDILAKMIMLGRIREVDRMIKQARESAV